MKKFMTNFLLVILSLCLVLAFIAILALPAALTVALDNPHWLLLTFPIICIWVALAVTFMPSTRIRPKK